MQSLYHEFERMREAGSLGDFPKTLGNTLGRMLVNSFNGVSSTWRKWCAIEPNIPNFKDQERILLGEFDDLEEVRIGGEPKQTSFAESSATYRLKKFMREFSIPWEWIVNDDIGAIRHMVDELGKIGGRKMNKFVISLLEGITASSTVTTALSESTLEAAVVEFVSRADAKSNRLGVAPKYLIVPTALQFTANRITKSGTLIAAGTTAVLQGSYNALSDLGIEVVPEPFLTDANDWYLAAAPSDVRGIEVGFLKGRQEPRVAMRNPQWAGSVSAMDDMAEDLLYRVLHVFGGMVVNANGLLKVTVS